MSADTATARATAGAGTDVVVVAVVSDAVHPFNAGGKEMRYDALLHRLGRHDVTVDLYTMHWWKGPRTTLDRDIRLHALCPRLPLYSGRRRSIRQAVLFAAASLRLLGRRFDVLEADQIPYLQLFPLKLVSVVRRRPFVVTWHEVWGAQAWRDYLGPVLGRVAAAVERLSVALPDSIVAASEDTASRLAEVSDGKARVTVVPNGFDPAEVAAAPVAAEGSDLLVVGRLLRHKGVHLALEALALLRSRGRTLTMTVVGDGPERARLEEQARELGLAPLVRFTGILPDRADVLAQMKATSVFVFPTVREGFGMAALEALACGAPVVTTDHPDNIARRLVVPDLNGYLCRPEPVDLADAVARALDAEDRLRKGARAVAAEYDWDSLAAQLAKVYRS